MKTLRILNAFFRFILMQLVIIVPIMTFITFTNLNDLENNMDFFKVQGEEVSVKDNIHIIATFLILTLLCCVANIYGLFLIKKSIESFMKLQIFTSENIKRYWTVGWIFIITFLTLKILSVFIQIDLGLISAKLSFDLTEVITTPVNGLVMGLFFLILSKVFHIAKIQKQENIELKQENELTI